MTKAFEFESDGKRFSCCVEARRAAVAEAWWWFTVDGDQNRYAPFRAAQGDTVENVKTRIRGYYMDRTQRLSEAAEGRQHWSQRGRPPANAQPQPPAPAPTES